MSPAHPEALSKGLGVDRQPCNLWLTDHEVLDVAFNEDDSPIRKDHVPKNLALIRHVALNLLRQDAASKGGINAKRLKAG